MFLCQFPGFLYGGDGDLRRFFPDDVEIFRFCYEVDGMGRGGDEVFKSDKEGDSKAFAESFFHVFQIIVFETVQVGRRFHDVIRFDHSDDDAALFCCHVG